MTGGGGSFEFPPFVCGLVMCGGGWSHGVCLSGGFFRVLVGLGGVLVGLSGEFVCGEVVALGVGGGGGLMGVGGEVVVLGGGVVLAVRHVGSPQCAVS